MKALHAILALICWFGTTAAYAEDWIVYEGKDGAGKGKHLVFLSGDEEYRSEEGLPMLAKILSQRHGFKCTILFAVDKDGTINPNNTSSLPGAEALDKADGIVMLLRFRAYPNDVMKHFVDACERGVPIVALRTSTHAFSLPGSSDFKKYSGFGKNVLGEQWVSHWGRHKQEATRGILAPEAKDDPILRGVSDVFGDSDVYEAYPPPDARILIRGQVLKGMKPSDPPAVYKRKRASDKQEQDINDPMMPVAWTRVVKNEAGKENKIFCTTMGAATDLQNEGLRRLVVNAVYWGLGMNVPAMADVAVVDAYTPTMYGFNGFKKGVRPGDLAIGKSPPPEPQKQAKKASGLSATPPDRIKIAKDFKIELLYSVPRDKQGSWVSMCTDPVGRLIACDQDGGLFRITPPSLNGSATEIKVEKLAVDIGQAQGLLWAFDSLYVMVNGKKWASGLYRVTASRPGGELDKVQLLRKLAGGGGEHGPHAIALHPDGKSLVVQHGNQTKLTELTSSRVPRIWGEDQILPRMPDGNGFMAGVLAPGGCFYRIDPEGKNWELLSVGYRNPYDMAFNRAGELFTYDADMEWDINLPWYRPTRLCLVTSGSEYGWRNGSAKFPPYYPDNLPAIYDIGPGSPTGMTFGYGAKFPAKYQEALFMCDWSYGKLYAMHLTPEGSAYKAEAEEFLSGSPMPLTDIVINPKDGAMYFAIGGRQTQSGLYRVTYIGKESTALSKGDDRGAEQRALRHKLEAFHGHRDPHAVETVWPYLGHPDRYLRFAARVALEFQEPKEWRERALAEKEPEAALTALLALVRVNASDPDHRRPDSPTPDPKLRSDVLEALSRVAHDKLTDAQRLELLRIYEILFNRMGRPDDAAVKQVVALLDAHYPSHNRFINGELCQLLVYLQAPDVAAKSMKMMATAPTQEEQIDYAKSLRVLKTGWTLALREEYFKWFQKAAGFKGGNSIKGYMANIRKDAIASLTDGEKAALKPLLDIKVQEVAVAPARPRPLVKKWTVDELTPLVEKGLKNRDFERGRLLFGEAKCYSCHRVGGEGGAQGPDLTGAGGRFNVHDLLESIIEPSKVISDQYADLVITMNNGKIVTGRIINLHGDNITVNTDMLNPMATTNVSAKNVDTMVASKISPMPTGLVDSFDVDEIQDLVAFLLSRGDRKSEMFRK